MKRDCSFSIMKMVIAS